MASKRSMRNELAALRQQVNMQANQGAMQPAGGYAQQPMLSGSLQNTG